MESRDRRDLCSHTLLISLASRMQAEPAIMGLKISLPDHKERAVLKFLGVALQEFQVYKGRFASGNAQVTVISRKKFLRCYAQNH